MSDLTGLSAVRDWLGPDGAVVVLAGGAGSRLFPLTLTRQKGLIPVAGRPLLDHVVGFWTAAARRFVFVLKFDRAAVERHVRGYPLDVNVVEPDALRGIAHGIGCARPHLRDRFVVVLGDCLCTGPLAFPADLIQGFGVWPTPDPEDIRRSFSVRLLGDRVRSVVEKPRVLENDLCGMGFYFFDQRVFEHIAATPPSSVRQEIEITDVIQRMIDAGEDLRTVRFGGGYLNVTCPADLPRAERLLTAE